MRKDKGQILLNTWLSSTLLSTLSHLGIFVGNLSTGFIYRFFHSVDLHLCLDDSATPF